MELSLKSVTLFTAIVLTEPEITDFRTTYEQPWNRLHWIRTVCAVLAFLASLLALFAGFRG